MSEVIQQRICIKFCARNQISGAETLRMLQKAFGDNSLSRSTVFDWYKLFKEGRELVDDVRSGRPSTLNDDRHVNKIKELLAKNGQLTVRDLSNIVGISQGSVKAILKEHLGVKKGKSGLIQDGDKDDDNEKQADSNSKGDAPRIPAPKSRKRKPEILKKQKPAKIPKLSVNSKDSKQKKQKSTHQKVKPAVHKKQKKARIKLF